MSPPTEGMYGSLVKANFLPGTLLVAVAVGVAGCANNGGSGGQRAGAPKAVTSTAFLSPGTVSVTNPGPAGTTGSGTVWVQWDRSQVTLQNAASWRLKRGRTLTNAASLESAKSIPAGAYTIVLSPCSKPGYAPPKSSRKINVRNGETTLVTVKYRH